ncbi:MAG TPA: hypothetical protein VFV86_12365, partial [Nitrososphaeraceae archaeon]|nr:hypothetical protein [Nitrososphaeraceae archaeon]
LYDFITYIEYDSQYLKQILWEELNLDINVLKSEDEENFSNLISILKSLWENIQQNKKSIRIIKNNLENTINIEEKLLKLFRRIIFSSLEYDYKVPVNNDTKSEALKQEIKSTIITQNAMKTYSSDYMNVLAKLSKDLYDTPHKFFKILNDLINRMNEQYKICYNKSHYDDEDIKPLKEMYDKLISQKNDLTDYSGKYQYLFSEIAELCDFWNFRMDSLWKKNARQNIKQINLSFSEAKYNDVVKIFDELSTFSHSEDYVKTNTRLLNKVGISYFNLEKYPEAYGIFKRILKIDENNNNALFNLGLTLQKFEEKSTTIRKFESVIAHFRKIIEKDHTNINTHIALSILFFKNGQYDLALEYIEKALQLSENPDWRALLIKGCILRDAKGEYNSAKTYFDKAEELNPNSFVVKLNKCQNIFLNPQSEEKDAPLRILTSINETLKNFEDRSAKIITKILLLYTKYFLDGKNIDYDLLQELLTLFSLKDSKLVIWNFKNLEELVKKQNISNEEMNLFLNILSIPGTKSLEELEMKKRVIQNFLNKSQMNKIEYIPNEDNNIKFDCKIIKEIKKGKTKIEEKEGIVKSFYLWEITVEIKNQINNKFFDTFKEIRFIFDPTFDNHKKTFEITKQTKKFSVLALGWDSTKLEIEIERKDKSLLKHVIPLQTKDV